MRMKIMKYGPIDSYTDLELALMVLLGYLGNGVKRRDNLGDRYATVQGIVQDILNTNRIPDGSAGSELDPEKLDDAIDAVFDDVLADLRKEIVAEYDKLD